MNWTILLLALLSLACGVLYLYRGVHMLMERLANSLVFAGLLYDSDAVRLGRFYIVVAILDLITTMLPLSFGWQNQSLWTICKAPLMSFRQSFNT